MIRHSIEGSTIHIETDVLQARVRTQGYTSGVASGSFLDKKTGARDLGSGLSIVDFLLEPADPSEPIPEGQYRYGDAYPLVHGYIAKRYVEGPQICTRARRLPYQVIEGDGFLVVRQWYKWHQAYRPHRAGSRWEQTLVFPENTRFFFSSDRVTAANRSEALFLRIDMPGHIKHREGDSFEHIYLSYGELTLPSTEFQLDFSPDTQNLYQRGKEPLPQRFIRAYQVSLADRPGPWLAGMTLQPSDVYEAWCHQRGYVCMIQEIGGWATQPGDTFGAAYVIGWFDSLSEMFETYDRYRGWSGIELEGPAHRPTRFVGVKQQELSAVPPRGG